MTREEAIEELKKMYASSVMIFGTKNDKETQEALKMAIEALKNIQVLDKIPQNYLYDAETEHCLVYRHKYTGKEIHILKPTDLFVVERPHGEWIYDDRSGQFICSECEGGVNMPTLMGEPLYKWCPWCNADMRKEGDEK